MRSFYIIVLTCFTQFIFAQSVTTKTVIYSKQVKDSFELYVSVPQHMEAGKTFSVIYYCDANLKSGKKLRELISTDAYKSKTATTIFVGVGHIGNYHMLRRRDFILPVIKDIDTAGRSTDYGQTELFYQFLKKELIPKINAEYKTDPQNNSILGHSLGGLFAFYCLFKNEPLFKNYYALSPALWIDHYKIYRFNKLSKENTVSKNLYFSSGGMEVMNHIKKGTNKMKVFLDVRQYPKLQYKYDLHKGKTHNSQVEKSLAYILTS